MQSTPTSFGFDGRSSDELGLIRGRVGSTSGYGIGINKENLVEKVEGIDYGFYYGENNGLFDFELQIFKDGGSVFTIEERLAIDKWFEVDYFADLVFNNNGSDIANSDIVYHCKKTGQAESIDSGGLFGIKITFQNLLPYPTTNTSSAKFDLTENTGTEIIRVKNLGNKAGFFANIFVRIELEATETEIKLENLNYNGYTTEFTGLTGGDVIIIDPIQGHVYLEDDEDYNLFGNNYEFPSKYLGFFGLVSGVNSIQVTGKCEIEIVARYPLSI